MLRAFLVERFSGEGAFKLFVRDYFPAATADVPWGEAMTAQTEALVGWAVERGFLDKVWPALLQEREAFAEDIQRIRDAWAATAAGNVAPIVVQAIAPAAPLLDRNRVAEIYRAVRDANFDDVRAALFAGLPEQLLTAPAVRRADAQVLIDLHRLRCAAGDPPPLLLWLENARLLFEREAFAGAFDQFIDDLAKRPVPAAAAPIASDAAESKVTSKLEAIVRASSRPALRVVDGTFAAADDEWKEPVERNRALIDTAIAATGRIEAPDQKQQPWIGTGVIVGPDLIAVAWHMIMDVITIDAKLQTKLVFNPRNDEMMNVASAFPITEVVFWDERWNIALLRVPDLKNSGMQPLVSAVKPPKEGENIVRVTYVVRDGRVDGALQSQIFGGKLDGAKWVLPGKVTNAPKKMRGEPKGAVDRKQLLGYDTNTLGGSGGPVISLDTGHLLGYSIIRLYLVGNWAVPMWEVVRDRRVRGFGITVPPNAPPPDLPKA